jgi:HSP20 family protein
VSFDPTDSAGDPADRRAALRARRRARPANTATDRRLIGVTTLTPDMDRDDREDPFGDFFAEIERMMNEMAGGEPGTEDAGFGSATHVDAYATDDGVRLVADLPAVSKEELSLQCDGEALTISAVSDRREYDETVDLPVPVDEHSANATFNNGILEVTFDRDDDSASIDLE